MKYKKTIFIILVSVTIFTLWSYRDQVEYKKELAKCPEYIPPEYGLFGPGTFDTEFLDCFGVLVVEKFNEAQTPYYNIKDVRHNYNPGSVFSSSSYRLVNSSMYIFVNGFGAFTSSGTYFHDFFVNGQMKTIVFNSEKDIPHYRVINTQTGEVTLYTSYDQMPEEAATIFRELENA